MYSYIPKSEGDDYDDSQYSQTSIQADQLVKRRIVHGEVEFISPVWDKMSRGIVSFIRKRDYMS